ncbi:MAG: nucleoside triphosphate pyrophosphohydrolase [Actinobacteria bacterium]|nr:nucleoside triphosphate pyrophosphohydrolase [Actinomycetota bacterium]
MAREDSIKKLIEIMELLRSEKGCPWDREQTHESIAHNLLEEAYEVYDAIKSNNDVSLKEELGDLLLQVVFHSQIAKERGAFDIYDVAEGISQKLVRRHPHVFGTDRLETSKDVLMRWEEIKKKEKMNQEEESHSLESVSKSMPSILYALNVQKKAARLGFDWKEASEVLYKLEEELNELKDSYSRFKHNGKNKEEIEEEVGDLLFAAINFARLAGVDPEYSLRKVTAKFVNRVKYVEALASKEGINLSEASIEVLDRLWERAKKEMHDGD